MALTKLGLSLIRTITKPVLAQTRMCVPVRCMCSDIKVPVPPKRPLTAYMMFANEKRSQVKLANPGVQNVREISRILGVMWNNLPQQEQQAYHWTYTREHEKYKTQYTAFINSLSKDEKDAMEQERKQKRASGQKRKIRKLMKQLNKPRRPLTAYILYCKENPIAQHSRLNSKEHIMELARQWREMTDEQKQPYRVSAAALAEEYRKEMSEWEEHTANDPEMAHILNQTKSLQEKLRPKKAKKPAKSAKKMATSGKTKTGKSVKKGKESAVDPDPSWMREE